MSFCAFSRRASGSERRSSSVSKRLHLRVLRQRRPDDGRETKKFQLYEAQKNAVDFKNGILDGYKEQVKMLCELIPVDSLDDTEQKSVEEVVESAISSAGAKLGIADKETDIEEPVENADRDSSVSGN